MRGRALACAHERTKGLGWPAGMGTNFACRVFGCGVDTICEVSNMEQGITGGNSFRQLCHSSVRCCF